MQKHAVVVQCKKKKPRVEDQREKLTFIKSEILRKKTECDKSVLKQQMFLDLLSDASGN